MTIDFEMPFLLLHWQWIAVWWQQVEPRLLPWHEFGLLETVLALQSLAVVWFSRSPVAVEQQGQHFLFLSH